MTEAHAAQTRKRLTHGDCACLMLMLRIYPAVVASIGSTKVFLFASARNMPHHTDGYGTLLGAHIFWDSAYVFSRLSWVVFHYGERGCLNELLCEVKIAIFTAILSLSLRLDPIAVPPLTPHSMQPF